jgi:rod shape-determining protein MreC
VPRPARSDFRLDLALLGVAAAASLLLLVLPASLRDPVAGALRGTLVAPLVALQRTAERGRDAIVQHDALVRRADSLALLVMQQASLESENAQLRAQLGLARALRWGFVSAEALAGRNMGDAFALVLTAGRRDGVERLSPVVSAEGVVGVVESVGESESVAVLWAHPDFRVSAMAASGGAFGIVRPHASTGSGAWLLELTGVTLRDTLARGTPIVSSGLGGTFPRGIPIGTVLEELRTPEGWARTYLVQPAVRPAELTSVAVLLPPRVRAGIAGAFAPADSARVDATPPPQVPRDSTPRVVPPPGGAR